MKKILLVTLLILSVAVGNVLATPIFNGNPYADFGTGYDGIPTDAKGPGYYIWANDEARTSWSVRWTGKDWTTGVSGTYQWGGQIVYSNPDGLENAVKVRWENDGSVSINDGLGSDIINFGIAKAGPGWDGFDFTLNGVSGDYLTFSLDSTFFTKTNDGIYIGQDMLSILDYSDSPDDFISGTGTNRQFEIAAPVPEPGTMVLLGFGLIGLAAFTRKRTFSK